jgi:two-component system phosphate regulon sensor histidine kinase PhoR
MLEPRLNEMRRLADVLRQESAGLLSRWRQRVRDLPSARNLDTPTLDDHIPKFILELATELDRGSEETIAEAVTVESPPAHGVQRVEDGFDIVEVVAEYNILRGCVHDLADGHDIDLRGRPSHILNRVLDAAIGAAVQTFAVQQALEVQKRREEHLAFVAHDLRTPLTAISVATQVLARNLAKSPDESNQRMLKIVSRNVDFISELVTQVLKESANVEAEAGVKLERRKFDLWPLVERLIHNLNPIAGTGSVRLANQVPDELVVYADAALLTRIFQNLIANAIVYAPQGEILIGARQTEAGAAECWVSDNGTGIEPERLEVIFEKFETDHEGEDASGLGLAIVKTFVEAHGGTIRAESEVGAGATFRFTLPGR